MELRNVMITTQKMETVAHQLVMSKITGVVQVMDQIRV